MGKTQEHSYDVRRKVVGPCVQLHLPGPLSVVHACVDHPLPLTATPHYSRDTTLPKTSACGKSPKLHLKASDIYYVMLRQEMDQSSKDVTEQLVSVRICCSEALKAIVLVPFTKYVNER